MPHHSGGGSFHGGSHHGSHSSHGGSSAPLPQISRRYYPGAHRYRCRSRFGRRPKYLYYSGTPKKPSFVGTAIFALLMLFVLLAAFVLGIGASVFTPVRADAYYDTSVTIDDHIGLVDEARLSAAMQDFLNETGVSPAVEIVYASEWNGYKDLEDYAFSSYVSRFSDEKHWLFVISYPDDFRTAKRAKWKWEGMIGDDLGTTIDETNENKVTRLMQKCLKASTPETLTESLCGVFIQAGPLVMTEHRDTGLIVFALFIGIFSLITLYGIIRVYLTQLALYRAQPDDESMYM